MGQERLNLFDDFTPQIGPIGTSFLSFFSVTCSSSSECGLVFSVCLIIGRNGKFSHYKPVQVEDQSTRVCDLFGWWHQRGWTLALDCSKGINTKNHDLYLSLPSNLLGFLTKFPSNSGTGEDPCDWPMSKKYLQGLFASHVQPWWHESCRAVGHCCTLCSGAGLMFRSCFAHVRVGPKNIEHIIDRKRFTI